MEATAKVQCSPGPGVPRVIYYVVPDPAVGDGAELGSRLIEALRAAGARAALVTADGAVSLLARGTYPLIAMADLSAWLRPDDLVIYSWPAAYETLRALPARLAYHCVEQAPTPALNDASVTVLTSWEATARWVERESGRASLHIGAAIPDDCFLGAEPKFDAMLVVHGALRAGETKACKDAGLSPIITCRSGDHADTFKRAGVFLDAEDDAWSRLTPLKAMAAGCVVMVTPARRDLDFVDEGSTAIVMERPRWPEGLRSLGRPDNAPLRDGFRRRAVATAYRYRTGVQRQRLRALLDGPLSGYAA
jgi:hypothetical protein